MNHAVVARIRSLRLSPRVGWVAPDAAAQEHFPSAVATFRELGVEQLDRVDLATTDATQVDLSDRYDAVYLPGGRPIPWREAIRRAGFGARLREFIGRGGLVIGASAGAMQLTVNVSLVRLMWEPVAEVVASRPDYGGLGIVDCEILPHLSSHAESFLRKVQAYSEVVAHDIVALDDGAALFVSDGAETLVGTGARFTRGVRTPLAGLPHSPWVSDR